MRPDTKTVLLVCLLLILIGSASLIMAGEESSVIYTTQLQGMVEGKNKFILVDGRTKTEFDEAHITGAVNIQEGGLAAMVESLPQGKNIPLVFYGNGVQSDIGKNEAARAVAVGFTNVMLYEEGFLVWEERGLAIVKGPGYGKELTPVKLTPDELKKLMESKEQDYVIVDVRNQSAFVEGHIPGAMSIPVDVFALQSEWLSQDKKIVVYCDTGEKSRIAYRKLYKLGYPNIYQVFLAEWKAAGRPVVAASCH